MSISNKSTFSTLSNNLSNLPGIEPKVLSASLAGSYTPSGNKLSAGLSAAVDKLVLNLVISPSDGSPPKVK